MRTLVKLFTLVALLARFALQALPADAAGATIYVSPRGDDTNLGTKKEPLASIERARDVVRDLKGKPGSGRITVLLAGGTYWLAQPLTFTAADSGTVDEPITYEALPGERPVLSGGRAITGWKQVTEGGKPLWAVQLPDVASGKWYFHQLWVGGARRTRARFPHAGFLQIAGLPDLKRDPKAAANPEEGQNRFEFAAGDIRPVENLADVDLVVLHYWIDARYAIAEVNEKQRIVTLTTKSRRPLNDGELPARYYLENAFEYLDGPGQWYLNRKTGWLYYWPTADDRLGETPVVAPVLGQLVRFEGKPEAKQFVEHITLRGLTFSHAEWWPARNEPGDLQAAISVPAAIQGDGARHCALDGCTISHMSNYGIHLARGCQEDRIVGCEMTDLGAGGVKLGETLIRDDPALQTHTISLTDNHIHDGGRTFHQAVGVWVGQSFDNVIAHNHIHDLYYTGISVGWVWGYGRSLTRNNLIEQNHIHDLGQAWLSDLAAIYTLGTQPGTVIRNNVLHDITAYRYGGWGLYFDEGSTQIVAEKNLVYRTSHGGFHQHYGQDNVLRNNIFARGRDDQLERTRQEDHRSFTFEHNIVTGNSNKLLAGNWDEPHVAMDYNLYWLGGKEIKFGKLTWKKWRDAGYDQHSQIADPLFANAANNDFRLDPHSPALGLGFQPLDISTVGPRVKTGSEK